MAVNGGVFVQQGDDREMLARWLKVHAPRDVLMPTAADGEKRPKFAHAAGGWTWARYEFWAHGMLLKMLASRWGGGRPPSRDIGLLLRELCVIDCDSREVTDELMAAFPAELATAPCTSTARGQHFYFARSPLADAGCFYDGASQRIRGVDFKTRARSGAAGFVVVAPSTNKARWSRDTHGAASSADAHLAQTWLRSPWQMYPHGGLPQISDALLMHVAVPRHLPPLSVALRFLSQGPDAPMVLCAASPFMATCTHVVEVVEAEADWSSLTARTEALSLAPTPTPLLLQPGVAAPTPVMPIPERFSPVHLVDLERVGADLELALPASGSDDGAAHFASPEAYEAHLATITAFADWLGAPADAMMMLRAASAGGGRNRADWLRIDRGWALACIAAARASEARQLVAVTSTLAATLVHAPLLVGRPRDSQWLLRDCPRARAGIAPGTRVLAANPRNAAWVALPKFVQRVLWAEAGHLALAGGAALAGVLGGAHALLPQQDRVADYDLFVYGFDGSPDAVSEAADGIVRRAAATMGVTREPRGVVITPNSVTMLVTELEGNGSLTRYSVQFVLRAARDPFDILSGFDLPPCKVLLTYEKMGRTMKFKAYATHDWVLAVRHGAYAVDGRAWSRATALRVFKYAVKGFDVLLPALVTRNRVQYALGPQFDWWSNHKAWWRTDRERIKHLDGFELLFVLERFVASRIAHELRKKHWKPMFVPRWRSLFDPTIVRAYGYALVPARTEARIQMSDIRAVERRLDLKQRSDYTSAVREEGRLWEVLTFASQAALRWMGVASHPRRLEAPLAWRQPSSCAQFHPVAADIIDALRLVDAPPPSTLPPLRRR